MDFEIKYPFTNLAKKIISEKDLINPKESLVQKAIDNIIISLKKGRYPIGRSKEDIIVFYISRLILAYLNNTYITNKLSIAISKSIYEEFISKKDKFDNDLVKLIDELNLNIKKINEKYSIPIEDFLKFAPESPDYYIYYLEVEKGFVYINFHQVKRIIQESITKKLINLKKVNDVPDIIKKVNKKIVNILPKLQPKNTKINVKLKEYPPCITQIIDDLLKHKNLNHYSRWVLSVYLFNMGVDKESIVRLFSNLPDFNEKITRYQINYIFIKKYKMPSCEKMVMYGLCIKNCKIKNPLEYGRKHGKMDKK